MNVSLNDRVALVTGAAGAIGQAICTALADNGARVVVSDIDLEGARRLASTLPGAMALRMDVTSEPEVDAAIDEVVARQGRLDVLVNNAGINRIGPTEAMSDEDWQAVLDVNLTGVFRMCRAVGARMLDEGRGSIVNIASIIGTGAGMPWRGPYGASKAGVIGLTQVLGAEWMGRGVRVNALLPGPVMTDMVRGMIERGAVSERNVVDRTPAGRFGAVDDVADAVLLLAADESAFITGQAIAVDGGYTQWAASHEASRPFGG